MSTHTEPRLRVIHRFSLDRAQIPHVGRAQLRWIVASSAVSVLAGVFLPSMRIDLMLGVALGLGAVAAQPRPLWRASLCTISAVLAVQLLASGDAQSLSMTSGLRPPYAESWSGVSGTQILIMAAILGLNSSWQGEPSQRVLHGIHGSLSAIVLGALGWTLALRFWPTPTPAHALGWVLLTAALISASMWAQVIRASRSCRIPKKRTIERVLEPSYRPPCLEALRLDSAIEEECDDLSCREGLGEVAAWVYRLQWIMQRMDNELDSSRDGHLDQRLARAEKAIEDATDHFARDRRRATLSQLHRLRSHRDRIEIERERALALVDFAMVNLEEARAQLILAKLQPGAHAPPSVHDVLIRLRAWAREQQAEHSSMRELAILA